MGSHFRLFLFMFQLILNNPLNGRRVPKKVFFSWLNTKDSSQSWDTLCPGMSPSHRNCYFLAHPNQFSGEVSFFTEEHTAKIIQFRTACPYMQPVWVSSEDIVSRKWKAREESTVINRLFPEPGFYWQGGTHSPSR